MRENGKGRARGLHQSTWELTIHMHEVVEGRVIHLVFSWWNKNLGEDIFYCWKLDIRTLQI